MITDELPKRTRIIVAIMALIMLVTFTSLGDWFLWKYVSDNKWYAVGYYFTRGFLFGAIGVLIRRYYCLDNISKELTRKK